MKFKLRLIRVHDRDIESRNSWCTLMQPFYFVRWNADQTHESEVRHLFATSSRLDSNFFENKNWKSLELGTRTRRSCRFRVLVFFTLKVFVHDSISRDDSRPTSITIFPGHQCRFSAKIVNKVDSIDSCSRQWLQQLSNFYQVYNHIRILN